MTQKDLIKRARLFSSFFELSVKRIRTKITQAEKFSLIEKRRILRDVDRELKSLVDRTDPWFEKNLQYAYKEGSDDVDGYLKRLGVKSIKYTPYEIQSIDNLVGNSKLLIEEALSGIHRSSSNVLSKGIKYKLQTIIAEGRADKKTLKEIKGMVANFLNEKGIFLLDSSGRKWDASKYAELFARTEMMNTYNQGVVNRMLTRGQDLAKITSYPSCECDICMEWEDKVVSLTGKTEGYPTMDDAYNAGVFHPNCKHRFRPYIEESSDQE